MAKPRMNIDKTEIVLGVTAGKKFQIFNLTYQDIQRIQFDATTERRLWKKVPSEKITIVTAKRAEPIVYTMLENKVYWTDYKNGLAKFAANNQITFVDTSGDETSL